MGNKLPYKYNLQKSKEKVTDLLFHEYIDKTTPIPRSADLRDGYSPIKDQKEKGECTAFSMCSILEYLLNKNIDLSEQYFYIQELKADGDYPNDNGSTIARSAEIATTIGTCTESLYLYDQPLTNLPSSQADADAKNHKAITKYRVKTIEDILYSVGVLKRPIAIGIQVYESLEEIGSNGFVPMPDIENEELLGSHAVNIAGFFYKEKGILENIEKEVESIFKKKNKYEGLYFIVRNSWNTTFGDDGYMYVPVEFIQQYSSDWWHVDLK